jgi:hypothetical protein
MLRFLTTLLCSTFALWSQAAGTGSITGIVSDATGSVLPAVKLNLKNTGTGVAIQLTSNSSGNYVFQNLIPGAYELTATNTGFKQFVAKDLRVQVGTVLRVDPILNIGDVTESITVAAGAAIVQTESGSIGQTVNNQQIVQLPLNGRNVFGLVNLVGGAAPDQAGNVRINGARARGNEYMVDGVTQVTPVHRGGIALPPPPDAIEEFKIFTNSYSAEYGNASGGTINVATRSGTNSLHGTLWEFLRNDKLNTRNFFAAPGSRNPVLRYNQFGLAVGGPVLIPKLYDGRNRTFFFSNYDAQRVRSQSVFNVTVPTAASRNGEFAEFIGPNIGTDAIGRAVLQGQLYDPFSERSVNGVAVRDPLPNNSLAGLRSRLDPAAAKLMAYFPNPTETGLLAQNFRQNTASGNDYNRYETRIDHNFTPTQRLFGRYSRSRQVTLASVPFRGAGLDVDQNDNITQNIAGAWNSVFSPTFLNELRVSFLQIKPTRLPFQSGRNIAQEVGIPNVTGFNYGLPITDIAGIQTLGFSGAVLLEDHRAFSILENLTKVRGNHTLKFGGEWRKYQIQNLQPGAPMGSFGFRTQQTGLPGAFEGRTGQPVASFLLGLVNNFSLVQQDYLLLVRPSAYSAYFQDDWKVSRRLTVNLGVRYDLNTRNVESQDRTSSLNLQTGRVLVGANKPGVPLDKNNFGPRVGFAYDVSKSQRTVLRGGYGIFYQPVQGGGSNAGLAKFPFTFTSSGTAVGANSITTLSRGPILAPQFNLDDPRLGFGTSVGVEQPNLAPYVQQWNLGVEHSLNRDTVVGLAYVGSASKKLDTGTGGALNINQARIEDVRRAAVEQNTQTPNTQAVRPYPNFDGVSYFMPRYGDSNYHSMQLKFERRFSKGVSILANYTWSKSIDNGSEIFGFTGGSAPQDIYNIANERAVASGDVPHRFVSAYVFDLPFGKGRRFDIQNPVLNFLVGGFQFSGITTFQSGRPFDVTQTTNTTRAFNALMRPNTTGTNPNIPASERTLDRYFNTGAFAAAAPLAFGTSPRNPVRGPGLMNTDLALEKFFPIREQMNFEFRAEAFNMTNTPAFGNPSGAFNPGQTLAQQAFGRITSAAAGRTFQLALKFRF